MSQFPPAFCPTDGFFPVKDISFADNVKVNMTVLRSRASCPICGKLCEIIPGKYTIAMNQINILIDPSISKAALKALSEIVQQLKDGEIEEEKAIQEAEALFPGFGELLSYFVTHGIEAVTLLISILSLLVAVDASQSTSKQNAVVMQQNQTFIAQNDKLIQLLEENNAVLQGLDGNPPDEADRDVSEDADEEFQKCAKPKVVHKDSISKAKGNRRTQVNKERRKKLREKRKAFLPKVTKI